MSWWEIVLLVIGVIIWLVGVFHYWDDLSNYGKSLEDYRKKFGQDLGMLVCIVHRSLVVAAWPVWGTVKFSVGIVRDLFKLAFGKKTVEDENDGE